MSDSLYEQRVSVQFRCRRCQNLADMIEVDGALGYVRCVPCGIVERRGQMMYHQLIVKYRDQVARNLLAAQLRRAGIRRPIHPVNNEISDPRWPFILIAEQDT